ncbi:hypothetical protein ACMD2_12047 [Ananas comosus]|uniref:Uncharacterized protein n=1 Tax=Ananas comosus TaxID=4615 RepID=A0A199US97_ANACO|nr:hypothetical protein ACMD2_12047 [Ananas comosus]
MVSPKLVGLRKVRSKAGSAPTVAFRWAFLHPYTHLTWIKPFPFSPPHLTSPSSISPPAGSSLSTYPSRESSLSLRLRPLAPVVFPNPVGLRQPWCDPRADLHRRWVSGGLSCNAHLTELPLPCSRFRPFHLSSPSSLSPAPGYALSTSLSRESSKHSGETISRHFNNVLCALVTLKDEYMNLPPSNVATHPRIRDNINFHPFKSKKPLRALLAIQSLFQVEVMPKTTAATEATANAGATAAAPAEVGAGAGACAAAAVSITEAAMTKAAAAAAANLIFKPAIDRD